MLISARRRSSGQDSAEREQVSPGLLFALKLNSIGWGFHRHQECTADAFAEQGERITDFLGTEKKFIHQVTPAVKVRTSSKVSNYEQESLKFMSHKVLKSSLRVDS